MATTTAVNRKEARQHTREAKKELKAKRKAIKADARKERRRSRWQKIRNATGGVDLIVVLMVLGLSIFGIAMVFSAGYYQTINSADPNPFYYLVRQGFFVATGLFWMVLFASIDYHIYEKLGYVAAALSIAMLVLVLLIGQNVNNAVRWINLGFFRFTPSEVSKMLMIIFTSAFLIRNPKRIRTIQGIFILVMMMGIHFALIILQPNLSTAIVIVLIMISIMIVAGLNLLFLAFPLAGAVAGYFYIMKYQRPYHWYQRLTSFVDPFADRQGDGYQVTQGLIALGNGGIKGLGFGKSVAKNMYLPEPQNDFILAILGEELGFIGFLVLMTAYVYLIYRLFMIALKAQDRLGFYLATGVAVMLGLQVIINVAVVTASMPATGITLPFISYGGTSIWSFMMVMGIALNVSKQRQPLGEVIQE